MGNSWKPQFRELEYESKMRLLKIHSRTAERALAVAETFGAASATTAPLRLVWFLAFYLSLLPDGRLLLV